MEANDYPMGTATMARKATTPAPPAEDDRQIVLSMKGTAEFRDWLKRLADHSRLKTVTVMELALVEYARNHGFKEAAPKRTK